MLAYVVYGLLLLMDMPMSADATASAPELVDCGTLTSDYVQKPQWGYVNWGVFQVRCPSGCATFDDSYLVGTGPFMLDSSICRAAIFAGEITDSGGVVDVHYVPDPSGLDGGSRNGQEAESYTFSYLAFDFQEADPNQIRDLECDEALEDIFQMKSNHGIRKVRCPSGCMADQHDVYGTGPFTRGSAICTAAIFAGQVTDDGGVVDVHWLPQQPTFASGNRSGGVR